MKPWKVIASEGRWTLRNREGEFLVQHDGRILFSSKHRGGEGELVSMALARVSGGAPKVLVGALGFGFLLRATLDALPHGARVTVSEASKALVEWNRGPLAELADAPLEDPRVTVEAGDAQRVLPKHRGGFDVILLDVDYGPAQQSQLEYANPYDIGGLSSVRASLAQGGRVLFFSRGPQSGFVKRLKEVGFDAKAVKTSDGAYFTFLGNA